MEAAREDARAEGNGAGREASMEVGEHRAHQRDDAAATSPQTPSNRELGSYVEAGLQLIPLHRWDAKDDKGRDRGKSPRDAAWQTRDYENGQVIELPSRGNNVGVRLTHEWLVLDVDPRNFPEGRDSLEEFTRDIGLDLSNAPHTKTGGGGHHYWFRKPADVKVCDSLGDRYPGLEFKSAGRQVVAAGSVHPNGRRYEADDFAPPISAAPSAPPALIEAVKRPAPTHASGVEPGELTPAKLAETLEQLDPEEFADHDDWLKLMMACHHATAGEGREEFIDWSTRDPQYSDHADVIGRRWDSLHAQGSRGEQPITIKYLHKVMQEKGGHVAVTDPEDDFEVVDTPASEEKAKSRWRFLSVEDLEAMPPPTWLIGQVLTEGSLAAVYGESQSFKSFLALDMCLSIATGLPWHTAPVSSGAVLYIAAEGAPGIWKRVRAWNRGRQADLKNFKLMRDEINLASESQNEVREFVDAVTRELGPLKLIVIDTLNQTAAGADENATKDMSRYIASMKRLRDSTGATVLVVHHTGKDPSKGMRGSSALPAGFDTILEVERKPKDEMRIEVTMKKQKDAEPAPTMHFSLDACDESLFLKATVLGDPAADFMRAAGNPVVDRAGRLSLESSGSVPLKTLVSQLAAERAKSERTVRREVEKALAEGRAHATVASDGTLVWLEREGKNPVGELTIRATRPT